MKQIKIFSNYTLLQMSSKLERIAYFNILLQVQFGILNENSASMSRIRCSEYPKFTVKIPEWASNDVLVVTLVLTFNRFSTPYLSLLLPGVSENITYLTHHLVIIWMEIQYQLHWSFNYLLKKNVTSTFSLVVILNPKRRRPQMVYRMTVQQNVAKFTIKKQWRKIFL